MACFLLTSSPITARNSRSLYADCGSAIVGVCGATREWSVVGECFWRSGMRRGKFGTDVKLRGVSHASKTTIMNLIHETRTSWNGDSLTVVHQRNNTFFLPLDAKVAMSRLLSTCGPEVHLAVSTMQAIASLYAAINIKHLVHPRHSRPAEITSHFHALLQPCLFWLRSPQAGRPCHQSSACAQYLFMEKSSCKRLAHHPALPTLALPTNSQTPPFIPKLHLTKVPNLACIASIRSEVVLLIFCNFVNFP